MEEKAVVGIVMGSMSDYEGNVSFTCETLESFGIPYEKIVLSAHRTPDETIEYAKTAYDRGLKVIIAAAGGAAHLAGVIAGCSTLPVIGIPMKTSTLDGLDSLLSIVQMPGRSSGGDCCDRQGRMQKRGCAGGDDAGGI